MFTIPGVMSFEGTAPRLNLLVKLCLRHCGNSLIFRSRDVASDFEQWVKQVWTCDCMLLVQLKSSMPQAIEKTRQR